MERYPQELIEYMVYFHAQRDYFECHEVMEEFWKAEPESPNRQAWLGLIQLAVGLYHHRRSNLRGAIKMLTSAVGHLQEARLEKLGLEKEKLLRLLQLRLQQLHDQPEASYGDINIPIADPQLLQQCQLHAEQAGVVWGRASDLDNKELIHKHTLRDRSDVIRARRLEIEKRRSRC